MASDDRERWMSRDFSGREEQFEHEGELVETRYGRARVVPGYRVDDEGYVVPDEESEHAGACANGKTSETANPDEPHGTTTPAAQQGTQQEAQQEAQQDEPVELTFDERLEKLRYVVFNRPTLREIFRKALVFCQQQRSIDELEAEICSYPEFKYAGQDAFRLIDQLVFAYGVDLLEFDEHDHLVTEEMKAGLTEDEIDDLVWSHGLLTTEEGRRLIEEMEPRKRISNLLKEVPLRRDAYIELLDFCGKQPRSYREILDLFHGRDVLRFSANPVIPDMPIEPSVFVDRMERAGGIVWDHGWQLTREGRAYLEEALQASIEHK